MKNKISILLDCLKLGFEDSLIFLKDEHVDAIQFYPYGVMMRNATGSGKNYLRIAQKLKVKNIKVSALCGDLGGFGFEKEEENVLKLKQTKDIFELAVVFDTNVITSHIGVIPRENNKTKKAIIKALRDINDLCSYYKVFYAIETGPEKSEELLRFLNEINLPYIKVNFDPANLMMIHNENASKAFKCLHQYVVHSHFKDGIQLKAGDPRKIYHSFFGDNPNGLKIDEYFQETIPGKGQVDFIQYLKTLHNLNYTGYLTIEQEFGDNRVNDIAKTIKFIRDCQVFYD